MPSQTAENDNALSGRTPFINGIVDSLPIVIGSMPVAFAFGLSAVKPGSSPPENLFFSCLISVAANQSAITASVGSHQPIRSWQVLAGFIALDLGFIAAKASFFPYKSVRQSLV
ncbi:hypothetical protein [Serratia plymuthica]|jgi:predicted branched-subunit amino acid permease|uniref:Uncharacterized protein n=2 Tax=Serratia plymuthica TaxID=82996 RepID=A0A318NRX7_SERPL|nr:hypothetical protein [Serratia plymuthica]AGP47278.1 hypothetical protein M621_19925 [Serratia plymuthica S13]KYG16875.1 Inner membrane protein YgaZ [Serratia plymuthica]NIC29481.1 hypothetical protein [Serratia plymuthica]PYD36519.1 hypothetical protein CT690_24640 [Serratia plymuthica]QPS87102.1 hypothetical protein I6G46_23795 [Serratia plymuthica]